MFNRYILSKTGCYVISYDVTEMFFKYLVQFMYYVHLNKTYMLTLNICGKNIIGYHFDLATTLENQSIPCTERSK